MENTLLSQAVISPPLGCINYALYSFQLNLIPLMFFHVNSKIVKFEKDHNLVERAWAFG